MVVKDYKHGLAVIKRLALNPYIVLDTETRAKVGFKGKMDALVYDRSDLLMVSACYQGESYSFPTAVLDPECMCKHELTQIFGGILTDPKILKVYHNARYDINVLFKNLGTDTKNFWDTMIGCWCANANKSKSLKERAPAYGRNIRKTDTINFADLDELANYAEEDAIVTDEFYQMQKFGFVVRLKHILHVSPKRESVKVSPFSAGKIVVDKESLSVFDRLFMRYHELPVLKAAVKAERLGMPFDVNRMHAIRKQIDEVKIETHKRVLSHIGRHINLNSSKQVAGVFKELKIPLLVQTKKGAPSVGSTALIKARDTHPLVNDLLAYRAVEKLDTVYSGEDGLELFYNKNTKRIHASLSTVGSVTGRNTCSLPNLMQIPSRKDTYKIKTSFGFSNKKNKKLIVLDFSQLEIRVACMRAQDPKMIKVLGDPKGDIHTTTATYFNVPRNPTAKNLNFLLLYGGGNYMLSEKLTLEGNPTTKDQAQQYINQYNQLYYRIREGRLELLAEHRERGYVTLLTNRRRSLDDIDWNSRFSVHKAETVLSNNTVQGSGQDLLKASIVRCDYTLPDFDKKVLESSYFKSKMDKKHRDYLKMYSEKVTRFRQLFKKTHTKWIMQVHDESIFETDALFDLEVGNAIAEIMGYRHYLPPAPEFKYCVPLMAEGGTGYNWLEAKKSETVHSPFIIYN